MDQSHKATVGDSEKCKFTDNHTLPPVENIDPIVVLTSNQLKKTTTQVGKAKWRKYCFMCMGKAYQYQLII